MVRTYQRKSGSRNYKTGYSEESLSSALREVRSQNLSIRKASSKYNIPYGTLRHKFKGMFSKKPGGQQRLSDECEQSLVANIDKLSEWKVPLNGFDIRLLVKSYLDGRGVTDASFTRNMPGVDWIKSFSERHNLSQRLATNVKSNKAEITREEVDDYFDNLESALEGIEPSNLYNYDETNVSDDPGAKKVFVRRGLRRRVERKIEHSKQTVSLMFCGNAIGEFLPPMVVYRAKHVYDNWKRGGPEGSMYESSKSGWFDSRIFEMWFMDMFPPAVEDSSGPVAIIGDNLPSHFSLKVIEESIRCNIRFITMPPNATHLCQPLDVAVFRPAKQTWRKILEKWRKESRIRGSIPKNQFPTLLKKLFDSLVPSNLRSGFRATGLPMPIKS